MRLSCPRVTKRKTKTVADHPALRLQWHPTKNGALTAEDVSGRSKDRAWWKCPVNPEHEWQARPLGRVSGSGCPQCAHASRGQGARSLAARFPAVAAQWHPTKNGKLKPSEVAAGAVRKVWWQCDQGHEWETSPNTRTSPTRAGCPPCSRARVQAANAARNSVALRKPELAALWHPTKNGELEPSEIGIGSVKAAWWKCPAGPDHEWEATPAYMSLRKTLCPFCYGRRTSVTNSLAALFPDVAREWHPTRNGNRTPEDVVAGTSKLAWWQCREDPEHIWKSTVQHRTTGGRGCPRCAQERRQLEQQANALALHHPALAREFDTAKNRGKSADTIASNSVARVWWRCETNSAHVWQTQVRHRAVNGSGCPFCSGRRVSAEESIAQTHPEVAAQWHPTKNGKRTPNDLGAGSTRPVWWKCPEGPDHEWESTPHNRTTRGTGCPCCAGKAVSVTNSLATLHPAVAAQWHPTRNSDLTPNDVAAGSRKQVWWQCSQAPDHEWEAPVARRSVSQGTCPFCTGMRVCESNSLATTFPSVAAQWHPKKNGALSPAEVYHGATRRAWWRCRNGPDHEWETPIYYRTARKTVCPFCAGKAVSVTNALATLYPAIAADWHPTKNGELTPESVLATAGSVAWWVCPVQHTWRVAPRERTVKGHGCPQCQHGG